MKKTFTRLTFLLVATIGLSISSFAQATDLFFSEYAEGSSSNKYLEIYNATGATVDLSNYEIWRISNGGSWTEYSTPLSGMLLDGEVIVIANSSADTAITNLANATTAFNAGTFFNGDDAMGLAKTDGTGTFLLIDAVGTHGPDPGTGWDVNGTTNATANHTMVRHDTVCSPDTNWTTAVNTQWTVYPSNTWTYAGTHTSTCAAPTSNDSIKPEVVTGDFASATSVTVVFSEGVTAATAQNTANYMFTPSLTVSSAVLSASEDSVTLTIASPGFVSGSMYTVSISNVTDTSGNANVMDPFMTDFYYNSYAGTDLMITEISHSQASGNVQDIDYFEIYNSSSAAISLAGLAITDGVELTIDTNVSIAAGGYFVFTENIDSFNLAFPTVTNVIEWEDGGLSGGGEMVIISNTLGDDLAVVDYGTSIPWPAYSNTQAIELCDVTTDYTVGDNWYFSGNVSSSVRGDIYGTPGMMSACAAKPAINTYSIATVRTVDSIGAVDSLGVYCAVEGVVYGVDLDGNAGISFTIIDETHGINVYSRTDVGSFVVNQGDMIRVVGTIDQFNGLTEIIPDSISVLSTGHCIPFATVVDTFSEMTESNFIEFKNVMFDTNSTWPAPGRSSNVNFITMNGDTLTMRIDADTKIQDSILSAPSGMFNLSGIGGQYDSSDPRLDGYQIFPMFVTDIDSMVYAAPADLQINEVAVTNASTYADANGDYNQFVELFNNSSANMDLTGYFISTDSTMVFADRLGRCHNDASVSVMVNAGDFAVSYLGTDGTGGANYLSTMLSVSTPYVALYTPNGTMVSEVTFPTTMNVEGQTYGAKNDDWTVGDMSFERGTPNASNAMGWPLSVLSANTVNPLEVYPNPVSNGNVNFNKVVSFKVYSITGQVVATVNNVTTYNVSNLENGVYIIKTTENEIARVVVK
jgi:hypothetical protein